MVDKQKNFSNNNELVEDLSKPSLYLELKPNLRCIYCAIKPGRYSRIDIQKTSIFLGQHGDSLTWNLKTLKHNLRVDTYNGLNRVGKSHTIHFRLDIRPDSPESDPLETPSPREGFTLQGSGRRFGTKSPSLDNVQVACRTCHQHLYHTANFSRQLPLPHDGWADMADNWFCCNHGDDAGEGKPYTLQAKSGDLLYGEFYAMLRADDLTGISCKPEICSVQCSRCKTQLGETTAGESVKVYYHNLVSMSVEGDPAEPVAHDLISLESTFAEYLMEQRARTMTFKFLLEYKDGRGKLTPYAVLLLLETDLQLCLGKDNGDVETFEAVKVLYLPAWSAKHETLAACRTDNRVSSIVLPLSACQILLDQLQHSTELGAVIKADNMFVGFLRVSGMDTHGAPSVNKNHIPTIYTPKPQPNS